MSANVYEFVRCPSCNAPHVPSQSESSNGVCAATCVSCGRTFKFRAVLPYKSSITLTVDGKQYTVGNDYGPSTVLNSWLRANRVSVGTKHMCYEGGCGTCLVEAKLFEPVSQTKISYAVNSCLLPLYSCDGMEIRTVDHIGNLREGLHPIQKQLADYNGTQCGYCTPGQVMNMFALKERFGDKLTQKQVEDGFDGTICRCTGYRPILKAFKDMATPSSKSTIGDIEDFRGKTCQKTGQSCQGHCSDSEGSCRSVSTHMVFADTKWYKPATERELTDILAQSVGKKVRFLAGNTSTGVFREFRAENYDTVIDPSGLASLYNVSFGNEIRLGAELTLSNLHDIFEARKQDPGYAFLGECSKFLWRIANLPVRNRGTWIGNICMKHAHNDFASDVFILLQVLNVTLWTGFLGTSIPISNFLAEDISHTIVVAQSFAKLGPDEHIKFYKVAKRSQNSHSYVTGGFRAKVDKTSGLVLKAPIIIAFNGLGGSFNRATQTETFLNGKQLTDPVILRTALATLKSELKLDTSPVLANPTYRTNLAVSLLYKFVLHVGGDLAAPKYRSGSSQLIVDRPISSGLQTYDTVPQEYPVTQALKKLEADAQVTGEAEYVDDMHTFPDQLEAAFVCSTVGNATLGSIDASDALKIPGVVKVLTAADIPGVNNIALVLPFFTIVQPEQLLASSTISYHGQPVAILIADSYATALRAARAVKVTYTNVQTPIVDLKEGIKQQSFFPKVCDDKIVGDADQAISNSPRTISGTISQGEQYHYHMETQATLCLPTEEGLEVSSTTQFMDYVQYAIAQITGLTKNRIKVKTKRCGGGYGGKITRNNIVAAACALAARSTNKPVKLRLTMGDNMRILGGRFPYTTNYEVGFTETGLLNGIKLTHYGGLGYLPNDQSMKFLAVWADNAYLCPNWKIHSVGVKTNKSMNTACRSPGSVPAIFIMESMIEHVAKSLGKDPTEVRMLNCYNKGATDPLADQALTDCLLKQHIASLQASTNYNQRQQAAQTFNAANRWKKKGLSLVPLKFGIDMRGAHFPCEVEIYSDGTVAVTHGGIEIGQGINTKVAQVCAYELGVPISMVRVLTSNTVIAASAFATGGSITSENCCKAAIGCCKSLNARIGPVRDKQKDKSWKNVAHMCYLMGVEMSAKSQSSPDQALTTEFKYYSYGAAIAEAEFDVLTGEHQVTRVDIQFDCGQSTNPAIDIGQVEGAFIMGLGYWTSEENKYDPQTGAMLTDSTWEYKPPTSKDIPVDFRVNLLKKSPNPEGVLGSKVSGEPPQCMSCAVLFAVKRGIEATRKDIGHDVFFPLDGPATPEACQLLCLTDVNHLVLQ